MARTPDDLIVVFDGYVGYFAPSEIFDNLFALTDRYAPYIESVNVEMAGGFKMLEPMLREEQVKRKKFIPIRKLAPLPDKAGKLRNFIQPILQDGRLHAADRMAGYLDEELRVFPSGSLKDTLDALELAHRTSVKPLTSEEVLSDIYSDRSRDRANPVTGY
jgi:hypothetical protein